MNLKYKSKILFIFLIVFAAYSTYGQVIISEYYEGSSSNKWIEVTNVGSTTIDLTSPQLYLSLFANAAADNPASNSANNHNAMSGSLNPGQVILYKNSSAVLPSYATGTSSSSCGFNGDDLIVISSSSTNSSGDVWSARLDVIGNGTSWGSNRAFYRNSNITSANTTYTTNEWTQVTNSAVDNAANTDSEYLGTHLYDAPVTSTTWTGGTDTDWATAGNWDNGVPTSSLDVTIPDVTNAPIIGATTGASVKDLTINEPGDGLTILGGGSLIVAGSSSGNITYTRTLTTTNWYLMASPVIGEIFDATWRDDNNIDQTNGGTNAGIAEYVTNGDTWNYASVTGGGSTFSDGQGYAIKQDLAGNISFTGTMNVGDESKSLTTTGNGYNLLGNPYPSYINSASILTANTNDLDSETIWIWNQATDSYDTKVTVDAFKIAPGQGFFVKSDGASGSVSILESYQSHESDTFQRPQLNPEIYLTLTDDSKSRLAKIYYIEGTTTSFDNGYDGEMFGATSSDFAIYTHLVGNEQGQVGNSQGHGYAVQSLPTDNYENMIVPVGINATRGTTINIEATLNNFPEGINVYLADKQENSVTLLETDTSYSTTLEEDHNGVGRFYIHTTPNALSSGEVMESIPLSIYTSDSETLTIEGVATGTAYLQLYTMLGEELLQTSFEGTGVNKVLLPNHLNPGIYIVRIATATGVTSKKIMIN